MATRQATLYTDGAAGETTLDRAAGEATLDTDQDAGKKNLDRQGYMVGNSRHRLACI